MHNINTTHKHMHTHTHTAHAPAMRRSARSHRPLTICVSSRFSDMYPNSPSTHAIAWITTSGRPGSSISS